MHPKYLRWRLMNTASPLAIIIPHRSEREPTNAATLDPARNPTTILLSAPVKI